MRSGYFTDFFSGEMQMIINSGSKQLSVEIATLHSTQFINIANKLSKMLFNNEKYSFKVLGFGSIHDYVFTSPNGKIKTDAVDI